ncbi:MAG: hypothetical protein JWL88_628 [Parcubacteria group bacterium]|nr:hypothetical protein [Parcubacteria group bacterium]
MSYGKDEGPFRGLRLYLKMLRSEIWEESHVPCALYSHSDFALAARGNAGALLSHDLRVRIRELTQICHILVIDELLMLYFFPFCLVCHISTLVRLAYLIRPYFAMFQAIGLKRNVLRIDFIVRILDSVAGTAEIIFPAGLLGRYGRWTTACRAGACRSAVSA